VRRVSTRAEGLDTCGGSRHVHQHWASNERWLRRAGCKDVEPLSRAISSAVRTGPGELSRAAGQPARREGGEGDPRHAAPRHGRPRLPRDGASSPAGMRACTIVGCPLRLAIWRQEYLLIRLLLLSEEKRLPARVTLLRFDRRDTSIHTPNGGNQPVICFLEDAEGRLHQQTPWERFAIAGNALLYAVTQCRCKRIHPCLFSEADPSESFPSASMRAFTT
jgi:hypothetical protein